MGASARAKWLQHVRFIARARSFTRAMWYTRNYFQTEKTDSAVFSPNLSEGILPKIPGIGIIIYASPSIHPFENIEKLS